MAEDKTLQGTLSGTMSGTTTGSKRADTLNAKLRRRLIEIQEEYEDEDFTREALYTIDNYELEDIDAEIARYKSIRSGEPIADAPKTPEEGRAEDRSRQMMYNEISSDISDFIRDAKGEVQYDEKGEPMKFDPNDSNDVGMLKNEMAVNHPELSWEEINAAVDERTQVEKDKQPEGRGAVEEDNAGSDFDFGLKSSEQVQEEIRNREPNAEPNILERAASGLRNFDYGNIFASPRQQEGQPYERRGNPWNPFSGPAAAVEPAAVEPTEGVPQYVKGERFDRFKQGIEDKLSQTKVYENTMTEPPGTQDVTAMQPGGPPPAEERYPDKIIGGRGKLGAVVENTPGKYKNLIENAADANGIPRRLFSAMLDQESDHFAEDVITGTRKSGAGAGGIGQFMPATAKERGVNAFDPKSAIPGSAEYLKELYDEFGSWELALAAYNSGPGRVRQYGGIPPFNETQNHVRIIMANA